MVILIFLSVLLLQWQGRQWPTRSQTLRSRAYRVNSISYDIDFPSEVVFQLEAEADFEITEVTLFYRLGRQKVRIFGYPSFTPSTRITAGFRIKTDGPNYIPSGVDLSSTTM